MSKSEKREATIRQNPKQVRFDDLDLLLRSYEFVRAQPRKGSSHFNYRHPLVAKIVTIPAHGAGFVKAEYVKDALARIDEVKEQIR
jgi:predicted RNA binding protein YcfA (HicA-like mRNA interferase family)